MPQGSRNTLEKRVEVQVLLNCNFTEKNVLLRTEPNQTASLLKLSLDIKTSDRNMPS
jgi:hypothetical protein